MSKNILYEPPIYKDGWYDLIENGSAIDRHYMLGMGARTCNRWRFFENRTDRWVYCDPQPPREVSAVKERRGQ